VPIVLKSGSLSLLEFSGPVQASNGIGLPLSSLVFIVEFLLFGVFGAPFFYIVKGCSNTSRMVSLDETMLNLQLYHGVWVIKLFICFVCSCITQILERTW
jgi:hypothetical protein